MLTMEIITQSVPVSPWRAATVYCVDAVVGRGTGRERAFCGAYSTREHAQDRAGVIERAYSAASDRRSIFPSINASWGAEA